MTIRRALAITALVVVCAFATPTRQSIAQAACFVPLSTVTQYWVTNTCHDGFCDDTLALVGESGVDCDGSTWSWGNTNPGLYQTMYSNSCPEVCE